MGHKSGFIIYVMQDRLKFNTVATSALFLALLGIGGVALLLNSTYPTLGPRWLMYVFVTVAASGLALPPFYGINRLLKVRPALERTRLQREALGMGVYCSFMVWLSIARLWTLPLAILVLVILVTIDYLLRLRENDLNDSDESARPPLR